MKFLSYALAKKLMNKRETKKALTIFKERGNDSTIEYLFTLGVFNRLAEEETQYQDELSNSQIEKLGGLENPFCLVAIKILHDGYLDHEQLNEFIKQLSRKELEPHRLLQLLLKSRVFAIDRFLELADFLKSPELPESLDYNVRVEKGRPFFFPKEEKSSSGDTKLFGRYEILEELARGGMGVVYKARHQTLNQLYALKVLLPGIDLSPKMLERFKREATAMAKLQHVGIVQIFDSGFESEQLYLAMELVRGGTLHDAIKTDPSPFSIRDKIEIILKIAEALQYAHDQGVIHRDLKPGNIFIDKNNQPKIGDFGLAQDQGSQDLESTRLTVSGAIIGTPAYMAPEQARGENDQLTPTCDVYALGICFYEFITGQLPFTGTVSKLLETIQHEPPPPPRRFVKRLHPDIETIILACLEKEPEKRYQSAKEMAQDLRAFMEGAPISRRPPSFLEKTLRKIKRHRREVLVASLILVSLIGYFTYSYIKNLRQYKHHQKMAQKALKGGRLEEARIAFEKMQLFSSDQEELNKHLRELDFLKEKQETQQKLEQEKESEKKRFEQATQQSKMAAKIQEDTETLLEEKALPLLLNSFSIISKVRQQYPHEPSFLEQRNEIAQKLVTVACKLKNYQLAIYVANQCKEDTSLEKNLLLFINQAQNQELHNNYRRILFWEERFSKNRVIEGDLLKAKYELIKMHHPKITEKLLDLLKNVEKYFKGHEISEGKTQFYSLVVEVVGYSKHTFAAKNILGLLQNLSDYYLSIETRLRTLELFQFLVLLGKTLGNLQDPETDEAFLDIREKMGRDEVYWLRTQSAYSKIPLPKVNLDSEDIAYLMKVGKAKRDKNHSYKEIIPIFERVRELDPENGEALLELGKVMRFQNSIKGHQIMGDALLLESENTHYLMEIGFIHYVEGEDAKAVEKFNEALEIDPSLQKAYKRRGKAYSDLNHIQDALRDLNKALELNPSDIYTYVYRGITYKKNRDYQKAIQDFNRALAYYPEDDFTYFQRGQTYDLAGDSLNALADFSTCIRLNPEGEYLFGDAYSFRGDLRMQMGDYAGAIADYHEALRIYPRSTEYYTSLGDAFMALEEEEKAIQSYRTAVSLVSNNISRYRPHSHYQYYPDRGYIYMKLKEYQKAYQDFRNYQKAYPEAPMSFYHLGCYFSMTKKTKKSIKYLKKALELGLPPQALQFAGKELKNVKKLAAFQKLLPKPKK